MQEGQKPCKAPQPKNKEIGPRRIPTTKRSKSTRKRRETKDSDDPSSTGSSSGEEEGGEMGRPKEKKAKTEH